MTAVKRIGLILLCLTCLCACSLSKHIARATGRIEEMYEQTKDWDELPERRITWHQALALLREHNLELKEATDRIRQAERRSMSIYTDMIPGVSFYGFMTRYVSDITRAIDSNEINANVNVTFSIPTLTQVPYRVYAAKVTTYAEIKTREGRERELISKLYQLVRLREIEEAKRSLAARMPEGSRELDKQQIAQRRQSDEKYWQEAARLLGSRSARWYILPQSMPRVSWEAYSPLLDRPGELVVCEFAVRLERSRLSQYGVALTYLPTINTNLYSPALFSSTGGTYQGTFLNAHDTRLNLNVSYWLDTHLSTWDSYQDSKASYEREKLRVLDGLMDHKNKVRQLRDSMLEYTAWRSYMHKRMDYLRQSSPEGAGAIVERAQMLASMEMELLNQEASAVEAEAAAVLEYGMPDEMEKRPKAADGASAGS